MWILGMDTWLGKSRKKIVDVGDISEKKVFLHLAS